MEILKFSPESVHGWQQAHSTLTAHGTDLPNQVLAEL